MEAEFKNLFADRLRGIPLVSNSADWRKQEQHRAKMEEASPIASTIKTPSLVELMKKPLQVEKRNAEPQVVMTSRQVTSGEGLLFKSVGNTASTANIVRNKKPISTTTVKPKARQITKQASTTSAPTTTTTTTATITTTTVKTTTRRPQSSKPIELQKMRLQVEPDMLLPITQARAITEPMVTNTKKISEELESTATPTLTRATQTLTTQPGYQRRTQQAVGSPRYTNKPNDGRAYPGENWVFFNRDDGGFSLFETLVLISNIMIVGTIVLVILMNWFKSLKKRQPQNGNGSGNQRQDEQHHQQTPARSPSTILSQLMPDDVSDQTSKMSLVSNTVNNPTIITAKGSSEDIQVAADSNEAPISNYGLSQANNIATKIEETQQQPQQIGSPRGISSEVKGGMSVSNKAMAIVQPTENTSTLSSLLSDGDKMEGNEPLASNQRTAINRSVSDLSGSQRQKGSGLKSGINSGIAEMTSDVNDRVNALNQLFTNGSTPNIHATTTTTAATTTNADANANAKVVNETSDSKMKPPKESKSRLSTNSLDSIDLPENLVETIKRNEAKDIIAIGAPSPNLLLGEVEELAKVVAEKGKTEELGKKEQVAEVSQVAEMIRDGEANKQLAKNKSTISNSNLKSKPTSDSEKKETEATKNKKDQVNADRPKNPMSKQLEKEGDKKKVGGTDQAAHVKNHQVVVNKLDKRKTNLEIVDLRDESVTGKLRNKDNEGEKSLGSDSAWISMDGVAVVQTAPITISQQQVAAGQATQMQTSPLGTKALSPSEIIESRFSVDYRNKRKNNRSGANQQDSVDSKQEEYVLNDIENELEEDKKMRNRKYFVYVVNDGHFTAKKECIARIELPPKRRITLAEMRQLIANSQDISLSSLRRNKFKFVTETYRLLNENEDAAVLHQVYPTQGVFLKLNIPEQEGQVHSYKTRPNRLSSGALLAGGSGVGGQGSSSSLSHTTIASRRRANARSNQPFESSRAATETLPAIEINYAQTGAEASGYGRTRASSVGRRRVGGPSGGATGGQQQQRRAGSRSSTTVLGRSKSSLQASKRDEPLYSDNNLPPLGRSMIASGVKQTLSSAASEMGANVLSGARRLFGSSKASA